MRKVTQLSPCVGLLLAAVAVAEQPPVEELVAGVAAQAIDHGPLPGLSVGVLRGTAVSFVGGFGEAEIDNHVHASEATVYRINSMTKGFTAVAVLQLVEDGKLRLDDHLSRYFREYTRPGHDPTLAQLLNHTSGLTSYGGALFHKNIRLDLSAKEWVASLNDEHLYVFAPGEDWRYSNLAYDVLGLLVEKASGAPLAEYLQRRVIGVAGMTATRMCNTTDVVENRAYSYTATPRGWTHAESWGTYGDASGRLCSTVLDLCRFWKALEEGRLVSPASLNAMRAPGKVAGRAPFGYGFGTRLGRLEGHPLLALTGSGESWSSALVNSPDQDVTVIVLTNSDADSHSAGRIATDVLRRLAGLVEAAPLDRPVEPELAGRITGRWGTESPADMITTGSHITMKPVGAPINPIPLLYLGGGRFRFGPDSPAPGLEVVFDTHEAPFSAQMFRDGIFQQLQLKQSP